MNSPLADRLRPKTLDEVFGQKQLLAPGTVFRRNIEAGRVPNMVFYGPPGVGKTTVELISYPRTSSRYLTEDVFDSLSPIMARLLSWELFPAAKGAGGIDISSLSRHVISAEKAVPLVIRQLFGFQKKKLDGSIPVCFLLSGYFARQSYSSTLM